MTSGLHRYQSCGDLHFLTFSCYGRQPYLAPSESCALFEAALENVRRSYRLAILGYVVMPEHVHLLISEPARAQLSTAVQALKVSVSRRSKQRPFWQARYHDFNVHSATKTTEKLRYIHRNPVTRGFVAKPEHWPWSSYNHYASGVDGTVQIESFLTAHRRGYRTLVPVQQTKS